MKISILTLFPKMISSFFDESIVMRAKMEGLVKIDIVDLRKYAKNKYGAVDDRPYGGGAGMILKVEPLFDALVSSMEGDNCPVDEPKTKVVLTSAKGESFDQKKTNRYAKLNHLVIVAGHYEGVDERFLDYVDEEVSLGDFVMTGGEITAAAIVDSVVRLIPGVLKKEEATQFESFFEVPIEQLIKIVGENRTLTSLHKRGVKKVMLLEYPQFTRPEEFDGKKVPEILLKGDHKEIKKWRLKKAFEETVNKRPDLLR